jgi:hypothetical protein
VVLGRIEQGVSTLHEMARNMNEEVDRRARGGWGWGGQRRGTSPFGACRQLLWPVLIPLLLLT